METASGSGRFQRARVLPLVATLLLFPLAAVAAGPGTDRAIAPRPPKDALLNLDLGSSIALSGTAATGDRDTDYWNFSYAPYQTFTAIQDLLWSTGDPSNVSVTIENAPGLWPAGHPNGMMDTFIHSFGGQPVVVTFQDLPNGTYDVYVYAHGEIDPQNSTITAESNGTAYGPETTTSGGGWLSPTWVEGEQYVLLEDVAVVGGSPLVILAAPAASPDYGFLNGIQLRQTSKRAKRTKPVQPPKPPKDALLNVDVANAVPWNGTAATGDGPSDVWNVSYAPYQYYTELLDLTWSTGEASGVTATIENGPGTWGNEHPDAMMHGYIYTYGSDTITVTLTDLPNGTYDLYVYAHGGPPDDQNSAVSAEVNGQTFGPESTTTDGTWLSPTWTEGAQYVLIQDIPVPAGSPLVIRSSPGASGYAFLNGFQIRRTSKHAKRPKPAVAPKPPKDALLNVDFGSANPWTGMAATGDSATDYWNFSYAPYQWFAEVFDMKWSNGDPSNVSLTVENAPGLWPAGHPDGMMDTFIHSFYGLPVLVTVSDLPNGTYDLYVYAHGVIDPQNSSVSATADGVTYGPEVTTTDGSWLSPTWTEGSQYVLLEDVSVLAGSPLLIQVAPAATPDLAFLNGIQIRQTSKHAKKPAPQSIPKPPKNPLLNLDLGSATPWSGVAATGSGPADYWNFSYAPYQYYAEVFDLKWSTGAASGASATIENAPGLWNSGHPDGMMDTFIHSFYGQPVVITFADMPNGTYDVYVYARGMTDEQNSTVSASAAGVVYGPETTVTDGSWLSPVWTEGAQYVLLQRVSVPAGNPLVIQIDPAASPELAFVSGIQLRQTSKHAK